MENLSSNPGLVEKLTTILEQAKRGELTSITAVIFKQSGSVDLWGMTRREDAPRVVEKLKELTRLHEEMSAG